MLTGMNVKPMNIVHLVVELLLVLFFVIEIDNECVECFLKL